MEQEKIIAAIIAAILAIIVALIYISLFVLMVKDYMDINKKSKYCENIGYNYIKIIGNNFNCCNSETKLIDNKYETVESCVAGK